MRQVHNAPWIQAWLTQDEPDMAFKHYTYANKTIGGVINVECLVARNIPSLREEAIAIAKKAAGFIMGLAQGPDQPLAYLPPTYYKGLVASAKKENHGQRYVPPSRIQPGTVPALSVPWPYSEGALAGHSFHPGNAELFRGNAHPSPFHYSRKAWAVGLFFGAGLLHHRSV